MKDGIKLPCGQCRGCRATASRGWAMRCMHEASMHEDNVFLTLTYDDEFLPENGSLDKAAFPGFMKRLRRAIEPRKVRYFHVGEYGEKNGRPHYHALLFGWSPDDKALFTVRKGFPVFTSELLSTLWREGLHEMGSVTPQSASYVARYIRKRITGSWAKAKYGNRIPEYATMSRNPGIGASWVDRYGEEVYNEDACVVRGVRVKPPRYYDARFGRSNPLFLDSVKLNRFQNRNPENETPERLRAMEAVQIAGEDLQPGGAL